MHGHRSGRRGVAAITLAGGLTLAAGPVPALGAAPTAAGPGRKCVGVVVDPAGSGSTRATDTFCAAVADTATGLDVLDARADALRRPRPRMRADGLLCAIDGFPTTGCGDSDGNGGFRYWSYWHRTPGAAGYSYSVKGAGDYVPANGTVEGWAFQDGGPERGRRPPLADFTAICPPDTGPSAGPASPPAGSPPTAPATTPGAAPATTATVTTARPTGTPPAAHRSPAASSRATSGPRAGQPGPAVPTQGRAGGAVSPATPTVAPAAGPTGEPLASPPSPPPSPTAPSSAASTAASSAPSTAPSTAAGIDSAPAGGAVAAPADPGSSAPATALARAVADPVGPRSPAGPPWAAILGGVAVLGIGGAAALRARRGRT